MMGKALSDELSCFFVCVCFFFYSYLCDNANFKLCLMYILADFMEKNWSILEVWEDWLLNEELSGECIQFQENKPIIFINLKISSFSMQFNS